MTIDDKWRWLDFSGCPSSVGLRETVTLMAPCPGCGELYLRKRDRVNKHREFPRFAPDFIGNVWLGCICGYGDTFYLDVPGRRVLMMKEVRSVEGDDS
ncbi:hypothetical protein ES703_52987 [subsurface metagenome]